MALVDRISSGLAELRHRDASLSLNDWADYFSFGGNTYPFVHTTMGQVDQESVGATSVAGFKGSGPIFSLVLARLQAFSQVRFQWTRFQGSQPTDLFGTPELAVLERPWNGGTTSDLLARMEIYASVAGCAYVTRPRRDMLSMLRPDRVTIIMGSQTDAEDPSEAPDAEIIGFLHTTGRGKMTVYDNPNQVAYYAPIPDPDYRFLGMSWITPVLRDLQADSLATEHKARFFVNAATPNLAIKFDASVGIEKVRQFKALLESEHKGAFNAFKTLYLGGGADPVPVGLSFKDMDYAVIQGRAESRLAAAAGVPPSWVGFAEGLQGSSLNAGNFNSARRRFSDGTMIHLWTNASTSLEVLLGRPPGATLWFDPRVPFMREDAADLAGIQQQQAATIVSLSTGGFTRESAIAAVTKNDFNLLVKDPNWVSVQLQQSSGGAKALQPPASGDGGAGPKAPPAGRSAERKFNPDEPQLAAGDFESSVGVGEDDDELDEQSLALLVALNELSDPTAGRAFDPAKHPRNPKGTPGGGRFRSMVDRLKDAIVEHQKGGGEGHPFDGFDREQLRRVAKARGIELKRGEDRDSIAQKLLDHLGGTKSGQAEAPSLNPPELTGWESRWWTILREDTGMDAVPVRDLELVGGYILKSGKAYRIDGITFIVEDGTGPSAERIVQGFRDVHRQLPPEADQYQQGYAWLAGRNPADAYWAEEYNIPGFKSVATAGDGAVRMWARADAPFGPASYLAELSHEFGHNVSSAVARRDLGDGSPAWARAAKADSGIRRPTDVAFSGRLALRLQQVNYHVQPSKGWPWGVSEYGTSSRAEDYAESMAFYLGDKIGTGRLRPGDPPVPIYFRDLFPERAKVLDQVFPEIAKRQKAAISAR